MVGLKTLVQGILSELPEHTEEVTDYVFLAIETRRQWREDYDEACAVKGKDTTTRQIGKHMKEILRRDNSGRCDSPRSYLIESYEKHPRN